MLNIAWSWLDFFFIIYVCLEVIILFNIKNAIIIQVSLYYTQIGGIYTGWKHGVERSTNEYETDISDLYWLNSIAEVTELQHKLNISIENTQLNDIPGLSSAFLRIVNETLEDGTNVKKLFVAQDVDGRWVHNNRTIDITLFYVWYWK